MESSAEGVHVAHRDGPAYRLAAVRETFEESGILLARGKGRGGSGESKGEGQLLDVSKEVKEVGRREVHSHRVRFGEWLDGIGGVADLGEFFFNFYFHFVFRFGERGGFDSRRLMRFASAAHSE